MAFILFSPVRRLKRNFQVGDLFSERKKEKRKKRRYYTEDYKLIATREQVGVGVGEDKMTLYSPIA